MAISVVSFSFYWRSTGGPGAHSAGFLYYILSATSLDPNSSGPQGPPPPGFLYHILFSNSSNLQLSDFLSWPSYIIVQRPLNRLLDLWNGMFDRHQAESYSSQVTLFRCISLWVYHGNFSLSHFVSQFPPTRFPLITAIGMCHLLPVHHLGWHFWPGPRPKYNTQCYHHDFMMIKKK